MFRVIARKAVQQQSLVASRFMLSTSAPASVPSVKDLLINLTFVDPSGARRKAKGIIGKTLYEVCEMQGIELGPASVGGIKEIKHTELWTESTFGEGVNSGFDHVVLAGKGVETAPRKTAVEQQMIDDYWDVDEIFEGSRLASAITLTKEMDGMIVFVPDRLCDDVP